MAGEDRERRDLERGSVEGSCRQRIDRILRTDEVLRRVHLRRRESFWTIADPDCSNSKDSSLDFRESDFLVAFLVRRTHFDGVPLRSWKTGVGESDGSERRG